MTSQMTPRVRNRGAIAVSMTSAPPRFRESMTWRTRMIQPYESRGNRPEPAAYQKYIIVCAHAKLVPSLALDSSAEGKWEFPPPEPFMSRLRQSHHETSLDMSSLSNWLPLFR